MLDLSPAVFAVVRATAQYGDRVLSLINVTNQPQTVQVPLERTGARARSWRDVLSRRKVVAQGNQLNVTLRPFDVLWLVPQRERLPGWVVVTDLDGTLLDADSYDWRPARAALEALAARQIPVVFCTSKTRAEVEQLRREMGHRGPFIVENGGAVFIPQGLLPAPVGVPRHGYDVIELGLPYADLVARLAAAAQETGVRVRGFAEMTDAEVAERTGLKLDQARLARQREYDEAFVLLDPTDENLARLTDAIERGGGRVTRGGRFHHVLGPTDKAEAVQALRTACRAAWGTVRTVGLGDAPNDFPLLRAVDIPILVGSMHAAEARRAVPYLRLADPPGPAGWNNAMLTLLVEVARPDAAG